MSNSFTKYINELEEKFGLSIENYPKTGNLEKDLKQCMSFFKDYKKAIRDIEKEQVYDDFVNLFGLSNEEVLSLFKSNTQPWIRHQSLFVNQLYKSFYKD